MASEEFSGEAPSTASASHRAKEVLQQLFQQVEPSLHWNPSPILNGLFILLGGVVIGIVAYGVSQRLLDLIRGVYLIIIVAAFVISLWLFIRSLGGNERLAIESHWGGLGGGLGGWRISRPLMFLGLSAVTFALVIGALTVERKPDLRERYRGALNFAASKGMRCDDRGIVANQLVVLCTPPSPDVYSQFWGHIKLANPLYDDIVVTLPSQPVAPAPGAPAPAASQPAPVPSAAPSTAGTAPGSAPAPATAPAGARGASPSTERK